MVYEPYYDSIILNIFEYAGLSAEKEEWYHNAGSFYTSCFYISKMPSLYFQLDQLWLEARPKDYMFDYSGGGDCRLLI